MAKKLRKDIIEQNWKKINKILVEINTIHSKIKELRNYNNSFDKNIQKEKDNSRSLQFRIVFY